MDGIKIDIQLPDEVSPRVRRLSHVIGEAIAIALCYHDSKAYINVPETSKTVVSIVVNALEKSHGKIEYEFVGGRLMMVIDFTNLRLES